MRQLLKYINFCVERNAGLANTFACLFGTASKRL